MRRRCGTSWWRARAGATTVSELAIAGREPVWRSLQPLSLVVNLVPRTWATLRNVWPLLLAIALGRSGGEGLVDLTLVLTFFALAVGNTVVHFLTLRYRVVGDRLELKHGLLNRQTRVIGAQRIQNVEMVRNVFHRLSGLVEVRIETASGGDVEGMLSALSVEQAQELISALEGARGEAPEEEEEEGDVVVRNHLADLLRFGATATRFSGIAVALGLVFEAIAIGPDPDPDQVEATSGFLSGFGGLALLVALGSGAWLVGTATAVANHYGFTLRRTASAVVAEQGLLTTRRSVLRLSKVQLVSILEPWLRRWFGFASVTIETAAAREGGDGTQQSEAMVPYAVPADVDAIVEATMPEAAGFRARELSLTPPHPRALVRSIAAATTQSGLFAGAVAWWFYPWGLLALALVPVAILSAVLDHRYQGWAVDGPLIVSRRGYLSRRTWLLSRKKIQSTAVAQGPILRRYGLGILQVRVAGSVVSLPAMEWEAALTLQQRLLRERHARGAGAA